MKEHIVLGIDIGGSGIKGGLIDTQTGEMVTERFRLATPQPATPAAVGQTFVEVVEHFNWKGPIGVGFPAIVRRGVAQSAANIDKSWIGTDIAALLSELTNCPVYVLNDADAAGIAAMRYGAGKGEDGVVFMVTIGTGIGTALFMDGELLPNTELGHLYMRDTKEVVEKSTSSGARKAQGIPWEEWGVLFNDYLLHLQRLFSPDLVIVGGGGSKHFEKYEDKITVDFQVKAAGLLNKAGAVGAAAYAIEQEKKKSKR